MRVRLSVSGAGMATRPGSGQCLLDCPEDGEPLATRRESERRETELTMDSLHLGERDNHSRHTEGAKCPGCDTGMPCCHGFIQTLIHFSRKINLNNTTELNYVIISTGMSDHIRKNELSSAEISDISDID